MPTFEIPPERPDFPKEEEATLKYWEEIDAFQESLRQSEGRPSYNFYDGPPFATGLPHYGHVLAGTIKDVVTRHAHQRGYHVERRFGWDCHGVPVEGIIDQKLNIKGRADVMAMGIGKYNEECRSVVQKYTKEWRQIVTRFGRWIDFDNDYKTMDLSFMESIWWVFKQLFDKGLVYRSFRVMPYSTGLSTSLSNFEANMDYKEVSDPSVIVMMKRKDKDNCAFLVWTTTPWTLPSNLAICVHPALTYLHVKRKDDGYEYIAGKDRFDWICSCIKKDPKKDFEVLEEIAGEKLVGIEYIPPFPYFKEKVYDASNPWHVVSDTYVTTGAGTCIVHQAPAYGEDDFRVCRDKGIISKQGEGICMSINDTGTFEDIIEDFKGQYVKKADPNIQKLLKEKGILLWQGKEVHNYPHCWRSETPLLYRAVPAWFVKVEEAREKILAANDETYWVPSFVKEKRFHNWLAEARDWNVSRSRYWGTPIPLWCSSDFEEIVCIGSVAELEQHAGRKITDIHRHFIDDITIPSKQGKGVLRRVEEVFDCWFESGSMPYSQVHYPFENKETFEKSFPAHFIAEGLDQTRGWFYTLTVLGTHLFGKSPFRNLIVNGLVLASDGKKMSKRLKNYPDPVLMCDRYGADAVRMYMCNSPVVRAEPLRFKEDGVKDVVKDVFLPWYHAYRFLTLEVTRYEGEHGAFKPDPVRTKASTNQMDRWIIASMHNLIKFVRDEMDAYRLYTVVPRLTQLLEDLTNWYLRLNRDRMRGDVGPEESLTNLCVLYEVLLNVTVLLAPVVPFIAELIYKNLAKALPDGHKLKAKSVHWVMVPEYDPQALDERIQEAVANMQSVVELGRTAREQKKVGLKMPVKSITIFNGSQAFMKNLKDLQKYLVEELRVLEVHYRADSDMVSLSAALNFKVLGKKLGKDMKAVQEGVKSLTNDDLKKFEETGKITICGHELTSEEMSLSRSVKGIENPDLHAHWNSSGTVVLLDFSPDEDLELVKYANEVANRVQKLRKEAQLRPEDTVDMWAEVVDAAKDSKLQRALGQKADHINKALRRRLWSLGQRQGHELLVKESDFDIEGEKLRVCITSRGAYFNTKELGALCGGDAAAVTAASQYLQTFDLAQLTEECKSGSVTFKLGEKSYNLKKGVHFALGPEDAPWLS